MLNEPRERDWLENGTATGDRAVVAAVVVTSAAACAAGENAGPNMTIAASITELVPIINDRLDFLCNKFVAHRCVRFLMNDGSDRTGLDT